MTLESQLRGKIVRQELEFTVGPCFTRYEGKVQYNPENIEKPDFFNLCYNVFKPGDTIELITNKDSKAGAFKVFYRFLVTAVDKEAKTVETRLLFKHDFLKCDEAPKINADNINNVINDMTSKINKLIVEFKKYIADTDDQLEEIENNIKTLGDKVHFLAEKDKNVDGDN